MASVLAAAAFVPAAAAASDGFDAVAVVGEGAASSPSVVAAALLHVAAFASGVFDACYVGSFALPALFDVGASCSTALARVGAID